MQENEAARAPYPNDWQVLSEPAIETETITDAAAYAEVHQDFNLLDFNPLRDRERFLAGSITPRAVHQQFLTLTQEYLTNLTRVEFEYSYDENDRLVAAGWEEPMEFSYEKATSEPGISASTLEVRQAELHSFRSIQSLFRDPNNDNKMAVLISPEEAYGCGYSFVTIFRKDPDTNSVIAVTYRIWKEDMQHTKHNTVQKHWKEHYLAQKTGPINTFFTNQAAKMLAHITVIGSVDGPIQDPEILAPYYASTSLYHALNEDERIKQELLSFEPVIEDLTNKFTASAMSEAEYRQYLQDQLKIYLIKAKVHFDPQGSEYLFSSTQIEAIQAAIQATIDSHAIKDVHMMQRMQYAQDLNQMLLNAKIDFIAFREHLKGSCDNTQGKIAPPPNLPINELNAAQLLRILFSNGKDKYGDLTFTCPQCNQTVVREPDELYENCPHCGQSVRC